MKHMKLCDNLATIFDPEFFVLFHAFSCFSWLKSNPGPSSVFTISLHSILCLYHSTSFHFCRCHSRFSLWLCALCVKNSQPSPPKLPKLPPSFFRAAARGGLAYNLTSNFLNLNPNHNLNRSCKRLVSRYWFLHSRSRYR